MNTIRKIAIVGLTGIAAVVSGCTMPTRGEMANTPAEQPKEQPEQPKEPSEYDKIRAEIEAMKTQNDSKYENLNKENKDLKSSNEQLRKDYESLKTENDAIKAQLTEATKPAQYENTPRVINYDDKSGAFAQIVDSYGKPVGGLNADQTMTLAKSVDANSDGTFGADELSATAKKLSVDISKVTAQPATLVWTSYDLPVQAQALQLFNKVYQGKTPAAQKTLLDKAKEFAGEDKKLSLDEALGYFAWHLDNK